MMEQFFFLRDNQRWICFTNKNCSLTSNITKRSIKRIIKYRFKYRFHQLKNPPVQVKTSSRMSSTPFPLMSTADNKLRTCTAAASTKLSVCPNGGCNTNDGRIQYDSNPAHTSNDISWDLGYPNQDDPYST